jgi:hypothetical protein
VQEARTRGGVVGVERQAIEAVLEDRIDVAIRSRAGRDGPPTGRFDARRAVLFHEPQEPKTGPIALLGVRTARENLVDEGFGLRSHGGAPSDQPGRTPLEMGAMGVGHVVRDGREAADLVAPRMDPDARPPMNTSMVVADSRMSNTWWMSRYGAE